jgi:hypothetical protein
MEWNRWVSTEVLYNRKYRRLLIDMEEQSEIIPEITPEIIPEITPEITPEFLEIIKNDTINHYKKMRNQLLLETDKYMLLDFPITPENLEIVKTYRQALRNFTNNDYIFPEKPSFVITLN